MVGRSAITDGFSGSGQSSSTIWGRFLLWRNRLLQSRKFQKWAARLPISQSIARTRAVDLHHILAGFVYSQTLSASHKLGLLEFLKDRVAGLEEISNHCELDLNAAETLIKASMALDLLQHVTEKQWTLGELGASIHGNPGIQSMLEHHDLLYRDMQDPVQLLRDRESAELRGYWPYVDGNRPDEHAATRYSDLMADSQYLIAEHILDAVNLESSASICDVGGGTGTFARLLSQRFPKLKATVFDLPQVIAVAKQSSDKRIGFIAGDMFKDPLPTTFDIISLVRILHDHDDAPVTSLLQKCYDALPTGGHIIIAEPMAGTRDAESIGHTYFGFYLWAMGSGKPRTKKELSAALSQVGFKNIHEKKTHIPALVRVLIARK